MRYGELSHQMKESMITLAEAKEFVTYDPETGLFLSTGCKFSNKKQGEPVGTVHKTKGYVYVTLKGKTYRAQRVAFLFMTGEWPKQQVDHINRVKTDNRWCNLRDVPAAINAQNRHLYKTNTSGYTGVCWNKKESKWQVLVRSHGKQVYGGLFDDVHDAGEFADLLYQMTR